LACLAAASPAAGSAEVLTVGGAAGAAAIPAAA
jgi:hypothetical protein